MRCPSCNSLGTLSPVGKAGTAGFRRWKCGGNTGGSGCKVTCSQVIVFGCAIGADNVKSWAALVPNELKRRINLLEVRSSNISAPDLRVAERLKTEKKVRRNESNGNVMELLGEIEKELQKELKSEQGGKLLKLLMEAVRVALNSAEVPEEQGSARVTAAPDGSKGEQMRIIKPLSYAKVAGRVRPSWSRPTVKQLEAPMDEKDRTALGIKALQWKQLKPINKRLIRPGQPLKEGPLKEKVETTKFVYIAGMTRQPYGVVRTALRAAGVDTRKIYDISFIGKQVGSLLTTNEYAAKVEEVLTSGKSTMKVLKNFNPLSSELIKRSTENNGPKKTPVELYARRAAIAVSKSKSLLVATKYQQNLPEEQYGLFKAELDKLMESKKKSPRNKDNEGKPTKLKCANLMEIDDPNEAQSS